MTDIEGFLTIYGHSDNLLNNNAYYCTFERCCSKLECYAIIFAPTGTVNDLVDAQVVYLISWIIAELAEHHGYTNLVTL